MSKVSPIPWDQLTLPEGRTIKACQVMIDKEKAKIKKAREEAGESTIEFKATPKVSDMVKSHMRKSLKLDDEQGAGAAGGKRKKGAAAGDEDTPVKKVRKGKKAAEVADEDEGEAPKKKRGKKAAASEEADEQVKEEPMDEVEAGDEGGMM